VIATRVVARRAPALAAPVEKTRRASSISPTPVRSIRDVLLVAVACAIALGLVALPLVFVFAQAFSGGLSAIVATFADPFAQSAIRLTLGVAAVTVAFNTTFGVLAAWTISKYRFPGKAFLVTAIDLPLTVSPVVAGLAMILVVGAHSPFGAWLLAHGIHVAFSPPGIALATIFVTFPYVAREAISFMQERGRELEEAALVLGANVFQTLLRVTLPTARAALINGILLCNARAMGEFGAVSVISGRIRGLTTTVPLHIEMLYNENAFAGAFALSAALALLTIGLTGARSLIVRHGATGADQSV
jgi:sulfate transport system permease protein